MKLYLPYTAGWRHSHTACCAYAGQLHAHHFLQWHPQPSFLSVPFKRRLRNHLCNAWEKQHQACRNYASKADILKLLHEPQAQLVQVTVSLSSSVTKGSFDKFLTLFILVSFQKTLLDCRYFFPLPPCHNPIYIPFWHQPGALSRHSWYSDVWVRFNPAARLLWRDTCLFHLFCFCVIHCLKSQCCTAHRTKHTQGKINPLRLSSQHWHSLIQSLALAGARQQASAGLRLLSKTHKVQEVTNFHPSPGECWLCLQEKSKPATISRLFVMF